MITKNTIVNIPNVPVFKKISEAIAFKIADEIVHKAYRDFEQLENATYPCDETGDENVLVVNGFTIDEIELIQFEKNNKLYWTAFWKLI